MYPLERIDLALNSLNMNPTFGPAILTAALRALVILALRIFDLLLLYYTPTIGLQPLVTWNCKYATRCHMAATAHARSCTFSPCPMDSPLNPFFWVAKRNLTNEMAVQMTGYELKEEEGVPLI